MQKYFVWLMKLQPILNEKKRDGLATYIPCQGITTWLKTIKGRLEGKCPRGRKRTL